jgi:hypothetical protein
LIGATAADGVDSSLVLALAPIATSSVIDWRDPEIGRVLLPVCLLSIQISVALQQRRRHGVATTTTTESLKQGAIPRTFRLFDEGDMMQIKETVSSDLYKVMEFSSYLSVCVLKR